MARMAFGYHTNEEQTEVTVVLMMDGEQLGHIVLGPGELHDVLNSLGRRRGELTDTGIPDVLEPVTKLVTHQNPRFTLDRLKDGGLAMAIRHPWFGWLGFQLPAGAVAGVRSYLASTDATASDDPPTGT